jgi:rubredoxin
MPRLYIPVFVQKNHPAYDEERAAEWIAANPKVKSKYIEKAAEKNALTKAVDEIRNEAGDNKLSVAQVKTIVPQWEEYGATQAQARFAATYVTNGFIAGKAYKNAVNASVPMTSANVAGSRMLQEPAVLKCIERFTYDWIGECRLELNVKILQTLRAQAFYDPAMFINADGSPAFNSLEEIPVEYRCCVCGIKKRYYGKDADTCAVEIDLVDRKAAIRELAQYINLMKDAKATPNVTVNKDTEAIFASVFEKAMTGAQKKQIDNAIDVEFTKG